CPKRVSTRRKTSDWRRRCRGLAANPFLVRVGLSELELVKMFFRRSKKEKQKNAPESNEVEAPVAEPPSSENAVQTAAKSLAEVMVESSAEVAPEPVAEPAEPVSRKLGFDSTADLDPLSGVVGQDRAV